MSSEAFIESWHVNNQVNLFLLRRLEPDALLIVSRPRARTVGDQFAHLHNARLLWLNVAAPDLAEGLVKVDKGGYGGIDELEEHLNSSSESIAALLERGVDKGKIKGYKGSPALFLAYLLAHEGHHRGQILLTLKLAEYKVPQELAYGIWEWEKIGK